MVELMLEAKVEQQIRRMASEQNVSEGFLIQEVVKLWLEDREDYASGMRSLSRTKYVISQEEMEHRSDVAG